MRTQNRHEKTAIRLAWIAPLLLALSLALGQTELELWTFIDPAGDNVRSQALAHVIDTFEEQNPGVTVTANVIQWQELSPSLLRAAQARRVPDVVMLFAPLLPTHVDAGTILPVNDYLSEEIRSDLVIFPEAQTSDGTIFAIPYEMRVGGIIYRADLFEAAGLELPRTLDELAAAATELTVGDQVGMAMPFSAKNASGAMEWLFPTLVGMGAEILNEDGSADFASEEAERLVQWVYDLVHVHEAMPLDVALLGSEETQQLVISGQAAMRPLPTHRLEFIRSESGLGDNIQIMELVTFDPEQPGPALTQGWTAAIPAASDSPDLAWKLIEHWVSPEMQIAQTKMAGYIPIRASVLSDPFFDTEEAKDIRWALNYASEHPMTFAGLSQHTNVLYDVWARMFEQVLTDQMSPSEGLAWAEREYDSLTER
ncbi:MAG: extracellular solute-binding protein [Trueperaceae bacterium]